MSRLLVIPDIHNAIGWAEAILSRFESEVDRTILLGDYFDSWDDNARQAAASARWLRDGLASARRVYLFGNHDISYCAPGEATLCSGWTEEKASAIGAIMRQKGGPDHWSALKCHHFEDGWLFTHAGVRSDLWHPPEPSPSPEAMEMLFTRALANVRGNVADPVFGAGLYRMGHFPAGGVTWLDFNEAWECRDRLVACHQVVGHSVLAAPRSILRSGGGYSVLTLDSPGRLATQAADRSLTCIDARGRAFAVVDTGPGLLTVYHCEEATDTLSIRQETSVVFAPRGQIRPDR